MKADHVLYRFPLCLLSYGSDPEDCLRHVASWCASDVGRNLVDAELPDFGKKMPINFNPKKPLHVAMLKGMAHLEMRYGDMPHMLAQAKSVQDFLNQIEIKHGKHAYVAMRNDFVWEVIRKSGISWREFSVLAAVYSFIGKRKCAYITRSVIQQRALGYKSAAMMQAEMPFRNDGATAMTIRQINYTLDRLHERKLFARVRKDPWHTFYSNRLNDGELETKLLGKAIYKHEFHTDRKQRSSSFMQQVKEARANVNTANVNTSDSVHVASTEGSPSVHGVSTLGVSTSQNYNPITEPHSQNLDIKQECSRERAPLFDEKADKEAENEVPTQEQLPTVEQAMEFAMEVAGSFRKNPDGCAVENWLTAYTAKPTGDWKKSLAKKLLDGRKSK